REHFFGKYPETTALVEDMTDDEIFALRRGGHDPSKIYAALKRAEETIDRPTVILAKTVKGYSMGTAAEGKNVAHQVKKMDLSSIIHLRDRLWLNDRVSDEDIPKFPYLELGEGSAEHEYLHARRQALHGYLPQRSPNFTGDFHVPEL
ncbi:MAG TPA: pyruvate dehydrogenase (acetyl-transferring), homodimeric type, partial [Verrucomicrobiales bacterium]|nr:pyruvate dehydrogenase (acetyl-transferring), homodimeric type [Verrucomicrobiales bacterium]